jgi:transposase
LRELKALVEIEKEDWARKMQRMLRRACHAANLARQRGRPLPSRLIARFERCYDATLTEGLAFHTAQPTLRRAGPTGRGRKPRRVSAAAAERPQTGASCPISPCRSRITSPNAMAA